MCLLDKSGMRWASSLIFISIRIIFALFSTFRGAFGVKKTQKNEKWHSSSGVFLKDGFGFLSAARTWSTLFHVPILKNDREKTGTPLGMFSAWTILVLQ